MVPDRYCAGAEPFGCRTVTLKAAGRPSITLPFSDTPTVSRLPLLGAVDGALLPYGFGLVDGVVETLPHALAAGFFVAPLTGTGVPAAMATEVQTSAAATIAA